MPRSDYYEDGDATRQECPRCGDVFLAEHEDRRHCGKCGYTEWK
jgi:small subunit ribosomal protein S27Ae